VTASKRLGLEQGSLERLRQGVAGLPVEVAAAGACGVRVTLDRIDKRNAIHIEMAKGLSRLFREAAELPDLRILFIAGAGEHFCGGVDLADSGPGDVRGNYEAMAGLFESLAALPQLSVALVAGVAFGAGMGLASACDMVVATAGARFACPEGKVGLIPSVISPYIVKAVGARLATEMFVTARPIDAARAHAAGLVSVVVEGREALDAEGAAIASAMEMVAPGAARSAKRLADLAGRLIDPPLIKETIGRSLAQLESGEPREGMRAFREKRKPNWAKQ
jgi:methylglutaconyl-CoA hydratase